MNTESVSLTSPFFTKTAKNQTEETGEADGNIESGDHLCDFTDEGV